MKNPEQIIVLHLLASIIQQLTCTVISHNNILSKMCTVYKA